MLPAGDRLHTNNILVICINGFYRQGGTERQIVDIACGLRARGRQVTLLSRWPLDVSSEYVSQLRKSGVQIVPRGWTGPGTNPLDRWRLLQAKLLGQSTDSQLESAAWHWLHGRLRRLAAASGEIVVHEFPFFGRVPEQGRRMYQALRLPVVHTVLGSPSERVCTAAPWAVVTGDGDVALEPRTAEIRWIPCMGPAAPLPDRPKPPADSHWRVLYVGRLAESKGVDLLLEAAAELPQLGGLTIVGDGEERGKLETLSRSLGVDAQFTGSLTRESVYDTFLRHHLVVVPSVLHRTTLTEGLPTVVSEALWAGRPVVASDVGGIRHLFGTETDNPGWLVIPGKVDDLITTLKQAMHPSDYQRAVAATQGAFEQILSPGHVLDQYESAYEDAERALLAWPFQ